MKFSPDGAHILISHWQSGNVIVWDAHSGVFVREIAVTGSPLGIAITPDGLRAVTPNVFEDTASILDLTTGTEIAVIPVGNQPGCVAVSPNGAIAAVGNTVDGSISLIDIASQTEIRRVAGIGFVGSISINFENGSLAPSFRSFAFAGNDRLVHPDYFGNRIQIVNVTTGIVTNIVAPARPHGVAVDPTGATAVVVHSDADAVTVVDVASAAITNTIPLGADAFGGAISINPSATKAAVAVLNACRVVDLVTGSVSGDIATASVNDLYTTADGNHAFCVGFRGSLINYATGTLVKDLNNVVSLSVGAVSPTEALAAGAANSFGEDFLIFTTNGASGTLQHHLLSGPDAEGDKSRQMALSPDGTVAAVTHILSDNVGIYDVASGALLGMLAVGDRPSEVAFTPDGGRAVVANLDSPFASILDLDAMTVTNVPISTRGSVVEISPDGAYAYVAVVTSDGVWRIDLSTQSVAGPKLPTGNMGSIGYLYQQSSGMTLRHDGATLAVCGSFTNQVTVIDTETWSVRGNVAVATFPVRAIFNEDDSRIYLTTRDNNRLVVLDNTLPVPAVLDQFLMGAQPFEMAFSPDEQFLYVLNFQANSVSELDLSEGVVSRSFGYPEFGAGLAVSADGRELFVPSGNWSVSFGPGPLFSQTVSGQLNVFDLVSGTLGDQIDTGVMAGMLAARADRLAVPSTFIDGFYTAALTDPANVPETGADALELRIGPNPATESVRARFATPVAGTIEVRVVDTHGRIVRSWSSASQAGERELVWDLRDRSAQRVPAGVYWLTVQNGARQASGRIVVR
jgi:DNA-binding beta-propeller fold protein YncE